MLVNFYLVLLYNDFELNNLLFINQKQFYTQLYQDLFQLTNKHNIKCRHYKYIFLPNITKLMHSSIFRNIFEECYSYNLKKQRILSEISRNSVSNQLCCIKYGCITCDVLLYRKKDCFNIFYQQIVWYLYIKR